MTRAAGPDGLAQGLARLLPAAPAGSQALVAEPGPQAPAARAGLWEMGAGDWRRIRDFPAAVVGRAGFAAPGAKREGDGRTPAGIFPLTLAFGYAEAVATGLPYRRCTPDDLWVDDPESPDYNRWVTAPTAARSFERMRREDGRYEFGVVVGYNLAPVVPGAGSAIFVHVWRGPGAGTAGCLALPRDEMAGLLAALRAEAGPVAVFDPAAQLRR